MRSSRPLLAFDFASPTASAALAAEGTVLAERQLARNADADLLRLLAELMGDAGVEARQLAGVVALAGPGSFTGLRIACAAALALAQSREIPAGGYSSLAALALVAPAQAGRVVAVVDAMRGEWFVQPFAAPGELGQRAPLATARLWKPGDATETPLDAVVGFGAARFAAAAALACPALEPAHLATPVAQAASRPGFPWEPALLMRPLYLRSPATSRPRP